ncbi:MULTISPECIES: CopD family protein [Paraburkholderia]|jgi:putative membrane protein|uniref:Protoporphyrinogen IX oxidase n=1 Tax=Paraburkholderia madseniana TaxID=2599607 RepID=A0A6N6VXH2_9BURK|nr:MULTISPECIES: CopD family protein [Paraburkholderia]KAE8753407.1 hypothetical protein FSO04_45350 [Paraburkholderia madseniana]MCX4152135.1 CopD family protein [Paraburkholderia madseniana]MCX4175022.1 CopD family protein [Paraburkholderia madseniana]MDN7155063.1 CopD family protein [Paraburkholderia sp. WS6]MDQ6413946.1 CopD family protein [Paraburkholderia madseniana]
MIYLSIKALHVASVITFVAGLLVLSICAATNNLVILRVMRRWDRRVTTPALAMVWITGPTIALMGHWFGAAWLTAKLPLVVLLSALHGMLAGFSRRAERDDTVRESSALRFAAPAVIVIVVAIVFLAVLKFSR